MHQGLLIAFLSFVVCVRSSGIPTRNYDATFSTSNPSLELQDKQFCGSPAHSNFTFQTVARKDSSLYIGATNRILKLSASDLLLQFNFTSGPAEDDEICPTPPFCNAESCGKTTCTNNYNKFVLPYRDRIVACGTLYATCDVLTLSNLSEYRPGDRTLKCSHPRHSVISTRSRIVNLAAAIYLNGSSNEFDLMYLGNSRVQDLGENMLRATAFYGPTSGAPYFTNAYSVNFEATDDDHYLLAWTTDTYGFFTRTYINASQRHTRISRLCHESIYQNSRQFLINSAINIIEPYASLSYAETEVFCTYNGRNYTNATYASYAHGTLYILFQDEQSWVICSITQMAINDHINSRRRACLTSNQIYDVEYIGKALSCENHLLFTESWATCHIDYNLIRVFAPMRILSSPTMTVEMVWPAPRSTDEMPVSFAVGVEGDLSAAFLVTESGNLFKVRLGNVPNEPISEQILLGRGEVFLNIVMDEERENIFVLSSNQLYKAGVARCEEQYTTCGSCLSSRDPYCGWCVLQTRCTRKASCENAVNTSYWIGPNSTSQQCPTVALNPDIIAIGSEEAIEVSFSGTPLPGNLPYTCQFEADGKQQTFRSTNLENFNTSPRCVISAISNDVIRPNNDHANVTLSIVYNGKSITSGSLQVFNCSRSAEIFSTAMCTSCVTANWGCTWCLTSGGCTKGPCASRIETEEMCPRVDGIVGARDPIPIGVEHDFTLTTSNLNQLNATKRYECQFHFCNKVVTALGVTNENSNTISCLIPAEQLSCDLQSTKLQTLLRFSNYIIDILSDSNTTVQVFNCSGAAHGCGTCVALRSTFPGCAWCDDSSACGYGCPISRIEDCGAASINSVFPQSGPLEGGTDIIISGSNLASDINDITSVTVGNVNCAINNTLYIPSVRIVCTTGTAESSAASGKISVRTTYATEDIVSEADFLYKVVNAYSYSPKLVINQTTVTVTGSNLDAGSDAVIFIKDMDDAAVLCEKRTKTAMTCKLPSAPNAGKFELVIKIDGYQKNFVDEERVEYVSPPQLRPREPGDINAFSSGGGQLNILFVSLRGVQKANIQINNFEGDCTVSEETPSVLCKLPSQRMLTGSRKKRQSSSARPSDSFNIFLLMNDVYRLSVGTLRYVADPSLVPIENLPCIGSAAENQSSQLATIRVEGSNFDVTNAASSDFVVTIYPSGSVGSNETLDCAVTHIEKNVIFCETPSRKLNQYVQRSLDIKVKVFDFEEVIPDIMYCSELTSIGPSNTTIGIVVGVIVGLCLIVGLIVYCHNRRNNKKIKYEQEMILKKLDDLENKTREAGRNAYFELQVGYMENLSENVSHRITYLPPSKYFMQTFFNLQVGHPVLNKNSSHDESAQALDDWINIMKNEQFVMCFIRSLEEQRKFTVKEKGNVASLLTICFFSDLPYFTKIMFDLLSELICRNIQKNPKLLLRRSESVVEKMLSHWLSITLYDECITEYAGKPIFLLTKAVHYLVNSAPCDVIANKAFNSLNEMTLLGSEISYEPMMLLAAVEEKETSSQTELVDVQVVNMDSITQAKTKIVEAVYKDRPYSECPKPDDLEFHLHSGSEAKEGIVLSDIDSVCHTEGNFTRLNTLKHYNVPDKAVVVLRRPSPKSPNCDYGGFEMFLDRNYSFNVNTLEDTRFSNESNKPLLERTKSRQIYHLIHPREDETKNGFSDVEEGGKRANAVLEELINRPFQEIFLTRMVRSKTALQEYVDAVFKAILSPNPVPKSVTYFFQFLDREATRYKIHEPEVIHIWKTNSLLLRYWVNVLKNPEFLFDINKTAIVDTCLNVITQAFMDACATTSRKLAHDSPSNKLLYAKESERYKRMVKEFFEEVSKAPWVSDDDINVMLKKQSSRYADKFNQHVAAKELFGYLATYREQILENLRSDGEEILAQEVEKLTEKMQGHNGIETSPV
ncbi:plexin-B2-like isoform X1 [Clavelina lepadiformis]|uniref:plexin-B2-like isoform X1 n=1 Tax=Clavelina lepadiformis TaxID=159417 RepID=UPI0040422EAE